MQEQGEKYCRENGIEIGRKQQKIEAKEEEKLPELSI